MEQKFKVGDEVIVTFRGIVTEAYRGYRSEIGDICKYKVESMDGTGIALTEKVIAKQYQKEGSNGNA